MKSAIPWFIIVVLLGATLFLYSANKDKEAELAKLGPGSQELDKLRAEIEELKKSPGQNQDPAKLRKDSEELIRLRSEAQRLREQNKQLSELTARQTQNPEIAALQRTVDRLSSENQALHNQMQILQSNPTAAAAPQQQTEACINNLRQIDAAKQQWALETKKPAEAVPGPADLAPYLPKDSPLVCPAGGVYTFNSVQDPPTCSVPGHKLP